PESIRRPTFLFVQSADSGDVSEAEPLLAEIVVAPLDLLDVVERDCKFQAALEQLEPSLAVDPDRDQRRSPEPVEPERLRHRKPFAAQLSRAIEAAREHRKARALDEHRGLR